MSSALKKKAVKKQALRSLKEGQVFLSGRSDWKTRDLFLIALHLLDLLLLRKTANHKLRHTAPVPSALLLDLLYLPHIRCFPDDLTVRKRQIAATIAASQVVLLLSIARDTVRPASK